MSFVQRACTSEETCEPFGHPMQVSMQVQLASTWDYLPGFSPSSEPIEELWVVCGLYTERWSYALSSLLLSYWFRVDHLLWNALLIKKLTML